MATVFSLNQKSIEALTALTSRRHPQPKTRALAHFGVDSDGAVVLGHSVCICLGMLAVAHEHSARSPEMNSGSLSGVGKFLILRVEEGLNMV
jgi:hypothetical protein